MPRPGEAPTPARRPRFVRARVTVFAIAAIALAGATPSVLWAVWPDHATAPPARAKPDPRYATQRGTADGSRAAQVAQQADEFADGALETCGGIGLAQLAAKYGVAPRPKLVARRYALEYEPAYRQRVYSSCLVGFRHPG
jgi:hypothetical protein